MNLLLEPHVEDVPIPEDLSEIPDDEYIVPDEGDKGGTVGGVNTETLPDSGA
jgi:hypothetical protein